MKKLINAAMFVMFLALIVIPLLMPHPAEDATIFTNFTLF